MALRWKKHPRETGLRSVVAGPQSSDLWDGEKVYATVSALGGGWRGPITGWYWSCPSDAVGEYHNTCDEPKATESEAKTEAMAWIKARLPKN